MRGDKRDGCGEGDESMMTTYSVCGPQRAPQRVVVWHPWVLHGGTAVSCA